MQVRTGLVGEKVLLQSHPVAAFATAGKPRKRPRSERQERWIEERNRHGVQIDALLGAPQERCASASIVSANRRACRAHLRSSAGGGGVKVRKDRAYWFSRRA